MNEILPEVEKQVREKLEPEYAAKLDKQMQEYGEKLQEQNKKVIDEAINDLRKKMEPPNPEDLQKLLDQEYLSFKIKVASSRDGKEAERQFVIRELPQLVEKKFYAKIKDRLVPLASDIAALTLNLLEGDAARKVVAALNSFEPFIDLSAELVAIVLDPYEEEKITVEWVRANLSTTRIVAILNAQIECNRMRDFFSLLSRSSGLMT